MQTLIQLTDASIRLLPDTILVVPIRPDLALSLKAGIIAVEKEKLPGTIKAKVVKMGPLTHTVDFCAGDILEIIPHAGTLLPMPEDHPERMILPIRNLKTRKENYIGVWEQDTVAAI